MDAPESTISNTEFRYVHRLAVAPTNASVVLAATGVGIFRSTDGGMSWAHDCCPLAGHHMFLGQAPTKCGNV